MVGSRAATGLRRAAIRNGRRGAPGPGCLPSSWTYVLLWNLAVVDRTEAEAIALAGGEPARELVVRLLDMLDQVAGAVQEVAGLQEPIEELERQVNRTSRNSSVAPSSDPPLTRQQRRQLARERAKKQLERERREARKQGGQPGHQGSSRPPAEPEQLTGAPVECVPERCGCGQRFTGGEEQVGEPVCHQQWELPVIVLDVREWRRLRLVCPGCGKPALAELPQGVSLSPFGPGCTRMSRCWPGCAACRARRSSSCWRVLRDRAEHRRGRHDAAAGHPTVSHRRRIRPRQSCRRPTPVRRKQESPSPNQSDARPPDCDSVILGVSISRGVVSSPDTRNRHQKDQKPTRRPCQRRKSAVTPERIQYLNRCPNRI